MRSTDIVARLQLKAEQFTSETGVAMTRLKELSRSTASEVRREFSGAFAEVQRTAQTALQLPRTQSGGLDLSQEIAQLKAQEAAAQNSAQAQRELAAAASAVAARGGESAAAQRLTADAAMVAERASVEEAAAIRAKILAYEELQTELNKVTSGTHKFTEEQLRLAGVNRSTGAGFTNLGQQFIDFTVQVQSGQSAATAFAQQLPQATYALSTMEGAAGKLGAALTGPFGTALTIAVIAATPFVAKLLEGKEASDAAKKATEELASKVSDISTFFDTATGAIKETNAQLREYALRVLAIDARKLRDENNATAAAGREVLGTTLRDRNPVFAERGLSRNQVKDINFDVQRVFDGGPNRKGIDAELRRIAESTSSNAAAADKLLEIRARYYENEKKIQKLEKERRSIESGVLDSSLITGKPPKEKKPPKPKDYSRTDDAAEQAIAAINAEWDEQPKLIDRARIATLKLDNLTEQLSKRELTPEVQKLLGLIDQARESIRNGMDRPFRDFVEAQRESLEVGRLVLAGRDADAEALQNILRLQQQMGPLSEAQVQATYRLAQQHQAINRLMEDQRRIVGIYETAWGGVLDQVDGVFARIQGNAGGIIGVVQKLQRDLLSNALFGGIDREIEDYIRKATGKQTPAEILQDQAKGAGVALRDGVNDFVDALSDATARIRGYDPARIREAAAIAAPAVTQFFGGGGYSANDNEIVVNGRAGAGEALGLVRSSDVLNRVIDRWAVKMEEMGAKIPATVVKGLKDNLGTVFEGAAYGGIGGSIFSAIGGKRDNTASSIGGIAGDYVGKELGKLVPETAKGLMKTLGGIAGPLGGVVGGLLGNVVGGLFKKTERGSAQISSVDQAAVVNGNYSAVQSDLGGLAVSGISCAGGRLNITPPWP